MDSRLYSDYLPAMIWLRKDEADRHREKSCPSPFPKFDRSVALPGKPYQQLALDDLAIFAENKSHKILSEKHSPVVETKISANTLAELFLPAEKKSYENTKTYPHTANVPVQRHLHPAQALPQTAKPIYALPACLVAGLQSSPKFQISPAGSKSLGPRSQILGAPPRPPKEIHKSATSQSGTPNPNERANLATANVRTGRSRSSAQTYDPVQFAQVPSHYDFHRQANKQGLQTQNSFMPELPPIRVVSALRFSGIFPNLATKSLTPKEIPESSRLGPHPRQEISENAGQGNWRSGPLHLGADLVSSEQQSGPQCCSTKQFDPVGIAQIPSHHNFNTQITNQELQKNKSFTLEIPPLRPVSSFRFSGIFPSSAENFEESSHSAQTNAHPPTGLHKMKAKRVDFPSFLGAGNDAAPSDLDTLPSQRSRLEAMSNTSCGGGLHRSIRRQKGYENLRMASTTHTLPPLPIVSPLAYPDFSLDL